MISSFAKESELFKGNCQENVLKCLNVLYQNIMNIVFGHTKYRRMHLLMDN